MLSKEVWPKMKGIRIKFPECFLELGKAFALLEVPVSYFKAFGKAAL